MIRRLNSALVLVALLTPTLQARFYGVATQVANPPGVPFAIDTDLNSPPLSDTWTSYALGLFSDDATTIGAVDVNLTGQFLQRWGFDGVSFVPSPASTNLTSGDSHLIPGNLLAVPPTEDNNRASSLPIPSDTSTRDYGVGAKLTGVWAYTDTRFQSPYQPFNFAYIVVPKGSERNLILDVKVASPQGVGQALTNLEFGEPFCSLTHCGPSAPPPAPIAQVFGSGILIPDNATATSIIAKTQFGVVKQGTVQEHSYVIKNVGYATLTLEPPVLTGGFSLTSPFPTSIPKGSSASFALSLDTSMPGYRSGSMSFANNTLNANPYNFALAATVRPLGIEVLSNGIVIPDNASAQFENVPLHSETERMFFIQNESNTPISLSAPNFTGPFSLSGAFPMSVPPLSSVPFVVKLDTSAVGSFNGSVSFENGDSFNTPYNFQLRASVDIPSDPNGKPISATFTRVSNPAGGIAFKAPDAALPAGWVSYQISLRTQNGELIDKVSVDIDGPLHQRWNANFELEPSYTGAPSNGRGDSHLTPGGGVTWIVFPDESNSRIGSPLTSTPGITEYGLGDIFGAWKLSTPAAATNVAYIVFREDQIGQLQIRINALDTSGASFRTITLAELVPEPSSSMLLFAALAVIAASCRLR